MLGARPGLLALTSLVVLPGAESTLRVRRAFLSVTQEASGLLLLLLMIYWEATGLELSFTWHLPIPTEVQAPDPDTSPKEQIHQQIDRPAWGMQRGGGSQASFIGLDSELCSDMASEER